MKDFLKYFWINSRILLVFTLALGIVPTILMAWDDVKYWTILVAFIFVFNIIGDIIGYNNYKKLK